MNKKSLYLLLCLCSMSLAQVGVGPRIKNDPFSTTWNGDKFFGASRDALYDQMVLYAPGDPNIIGFAGVDPNAGDVYYHVSSGSPAIFSSFPTSEWWRDSAAEPNSAVYKINQLNDFVWNVVDYGADPTGSADSYAAIDFCLDKALAAGGGMVYLPRGTYKSTGTLIVDYACTLVGDGRAATTIMSYVTDANGIQIGQGGAGVHNTTVRGFKLDMSNATGSTCSGIVLYPDTWESMIDDVWIYAAPDDGLHAVVDEGTTGAQYRNTISNIYISECGDDGIYFEGGEVGVVVTSIGFDHIRVLSCGGCGYHGVRSSGIVFNDFVFEDCDGGGIYLDGPGIHTFTGYGCENGDGYGFTWINPRSIQSVTCDCKLHGLAGGIDPRGLTPTTWPQSGSWPRYDGGIMFQTVEHTIGFDQGAVEPNTGDLIYGVTSTVTGTVKSVTLSGGAWDGSGYGYVVCYGSPGTYTDEEELTINSTTVAHVETDNGNNRKKTLGPIWYNPGTSWVTAELNNGTWQMVRSSDGAQIYAVSAATKTSYVYNGLVVDGDPGAGVSGRTTFTGETYGVSTGTGSVLMASSNPGNSAGWIKIYVGGTAAWIPYWTTIAP